MMTLKGETLLLENAGNNISKPLDFKNFLGGMPPDPLAARAPLISPLLRHCPFLSRMPLVARFRRSSLLTESLEQAIVLFE